MKKFYDSPREKFFKRRTYSLDPFYQHYFLSLLVRTCPCLSMLVPAYPCLSLYVLVCLCLSLYVHTFAIPSCLPLQMNISVFISMNIVILTFIAKGTVPMHSNLVLNFFFTSHLASSVTRSFNPSSSIPVLNITEGFTLFLLSFYCK